MNAAEKIVARMYANRSGRAIPVRSVRALAPDPDATFGIAVVKVATEEIVQAIAYGDLQCDPQVIPRINPMSRDVSDLIPFAEWLVSNASVAVENDRDLRIWVPHPAALDCIGVMGERYWANKEAPDIIQQMGLICKMLFEASRYPGQQSVGVASSVLCEHFVTGQMPIEDRHTGAMLTWLLPPKFEGTKAVADEAARQSLSALLVNTPDRRDDDVVEALRRTYKKAIRTGDKITEREAVGGIRRILKDGALREWTFLHMAWAAYQAADLIDNGWDVERKHSRARFNTWFRQNYSITPRKPHTLSMHRDDLEAAHQRVEQHTVRIDPIEREAAVRRGDVLRVKITSITQPTAGRRPCTFVAETLQGAPKVRLDEQLESPDGKIYAIVRTIQKDNVTGRTELDMEVSKGFRSTGRLSPGSQLDWLSSAPDLSFIKAGSYWDAVNRSSWAVMGDDGKPAAGVALPSGDVIALGDRLRKT